MLHLTPHLEKLNATLKNDKLPSVDYARVCDAIQRYQQWIEDLKAANGNADEVIKRRVGLLNQYLDYVNLGLIFDSPADFLYRQKGQLKLDNSVIEEFLPWLVTPTTIAGISDDLILGPTKSFSSVYFESTLAQPIRGAGIHIRTKNQDFAISRRLYVKASYSPEFIGAATTDTHIAYVATEIKTNLDKTMFQEACATARDLKMAVPGALYFLMSEWLDMIPLSTAQTDIEEVLLLRGAKRMGSNERRHFSSSAGRMKKRQLYAEHLSQHPIRVDVFQRWIAHIRLSFIDEAPEELGILKQGYF